ncbi:chromatin modification-related protein eaf6-like [Papaver somniferum]|uniref:chromatin modification-related protein eaf6-like n=1 Tax=Papaver somniferum TaxID=3469 RepID=UPI000E70117B|nr:chromatin modification-related protein eaf6-like [Papaver somniferum]XP_026457499.1 chromatin modification-related protein eaf6-like [Papaver somniferum]XP_026457500.1 chromatin modification-related protein eaf6-like [Papaver somniferum]
METEGQRSSSNPSQVLTSLMSKREKLQEELRGIEKQVHELETSYLQDSSQGGNVLKGFEGFLSSTKSTTNLKRSRKFQPEDRLFSLSSVTSPAVEEHMVGRDDGRSDFGLGRSKGAGANGQGKPKKGGGRNTPRDIRRIRPSSEHDMDDEDDLDLSLR